jgi:hypothetical protein
MTKTNFSNNILKRLKNETTDYEKAERLRERKARENKAAHEGDGPALSYFKAKMKDALFISIILVIYMLITHPSPTDSDITFAIIYSTLCIILLRNSILRFFRKISSRSR